MQFIEHIGADIPARFYIDGKRVSRRDYDAAKDSCARLDCFATKGKQLPGGLIRRTNYVNGY